MMNSRLNEILGSEPTAEEVEFRRNVSMWWKLVYKPGYCVELRMLDDKNGATSSGYYDCFESFFDVVERCNAKANIYTTILPVPLDMLARYDNKQYGNWIAKRTGIADHDIKVLKTTKDEDMVLENLMVIDVDSKHPKGTSATDEELGYAVERAETIARSFQDKWNVDCVVGTSGNGAYIILRVEERDLTEEVCVERQAMCSFLHKLNKDKEEQDAERSGGPIRTDVDEKVFNPSRIIRVLGTRNIRGEDCPKVGRIHRNSRFFEDRLPVLQANIYEVCGTQAMAHFEGLNAKPVAKTSKKSIQKQLPKTTSVTPTKVASISRVDRNYSPTDENSRLKRARKYVEKIDGAESGMDGHGQTFSVAMVLVQDFALSDDDAATLMDEYNERCQPPWSSKELAHKLEDAVRAIDGTLLGRKLRDGRQATSAANGTSGGRPQVNYGLISDQILDIWKTQDTRHKYWHGQWYIYDNLYYRMTTSSDFECRMRKVMTELGIIANNNMVSNVMRDLESKCYLSDSLHSPCWTDSNTSADGWMLLKDRLVCVSKLAKSVGGEEIPDEEIFRPATHHLFSTLHMDYSYDPDATCPKWLKYVSEVQPNAKDQELLQMLFGLCLIQDTSYNVFFLLTGEGGCGKSVFGHVLTKIVGSANTCCVPISNFTSRFLTWPLASHLLNFVPDMKSAEYGRSDNAEGILKQVCSGELMSVERKNMDVYEDEATARCVFLCNEIPFFNDRSLALWDRLRVIPFEQRFRKTKRDNPRLKNEIEDEELAGVFMWAVEGLAKLLKFRFFPEHSKGAEKKDEHRIECDTEQLFFRDSIEVTGEEEDHVSTRILYHSYREWCKTNGYHSKCEAKFSQAVGRLDGVERKRKYSKGVQQMSYLGVRHVKEHHEFAFSAEPSAS